MRQIHSPSDWQKFLLYHFLRRNLYGCRTPLPHQRGAFWDMGWHLLFPALLFGKRNILFPSTTSFWSQLSVAGRQHSKLQDNFFNKGLWPVSLLWQLFHHLPALYPLSLISLSTAWPTNCQNCTQLQLYSFITISAAVSWWRPHLHTSLKRPLSLG